MNMKRSDFGAALVDNTHNGITALCHYYDVLLVQGPFQSKHKAHNTQITEDKEKKTILVSSIPPAGT